ncbi:MAG: DUF6992 family protein [Sediminibacterium sp.]|jgi:hypothetical protein
MLKKTFIFIFTSLLFCGKINGQSLNWDSLNKRRLEINRQHLYILGAWGAANLIQGSISASNSNGSARYFHQMNAYWNGVNVAIAGLGLLGLKYQLKQSFGPAQMIQEQRVLEKFLLLNTGLDAAYITTGLFLRERGLRLNNDRNKGFGNSLIFQGSFLLVLDLVHYFAHQKNGKALQDQVNKLQWNVGTNGAGLTYRF